MKRLTGEQLALLEIDRILREALPPELDHHNAPLTLAVEAVLRMIPKVLAAPPPKPNGLMLRYIQP